MKNKNKILFIHQASSAKVENTVSDCLNSFLKYSGNDIEKISINEFNNRPAA
jgi:hypothetical protein